MTNFVPLAMSDAMVITFNLINIALTLLMGVGLAYVATVQRKSERKDDARNESIKALEARLHDTATKLVDERFRAMTHALNNHVQGFTTALDELKERVLQANTDVDGLAREDHQLEVKTLQRMDQIKDYFRDALASAMRAHESTVDKKLERIEQKIDSVKNFQQPRTR